MWINREVNIPESLISAQREGRLVVFAGAGISMGSPSNLPSFAGLAERIAAGALPRGRDEPLDRYLGRLERNGTNIDARARAIIGDPDSKPRRLHREILELFGSADAVRVVTTNFDSHLTTAAREAYGDAVGLYYAPALPLGNEFKGIVYLHGSIERPEPLVLSDRSFGRAYLTDWWATRMLTEVFRSFVVLFVGYSHSDVVMQYLARSVVAEARFSMTVGDQDEHWEYLGIEPVHFPLRPDPEPFSALEDALQAWTTVARMGVFDHERRIADIVQSPPPLDVENADYIEAAVREPVRLRLFVKHARMIEWLRWTEEKGHLAPLFTYDEVKGEVPKELAFWIASAFAQVQSQFVIDLVRRNRLRLNPLLWHALARQLVYGETKPRGAMLAAWALILVSTVTPDCAEDFLTDLLLLHCAGDDEIDAALLLLGHLLRPRIVLESPWLGDEAHERPVTLQAEIKLRGDSDDLFRSWTEYFKPRLGATHRQLGGLLTWCLSDAHQLLRAAGNANPDWDPLSFRRSAVEPHAQDAHRRDWEIWVDAARDLMEWLLENRPSEAQRLRDDWSEATPALLRRLAVHAHTVDSSLSGDAALQVLEERQWLYQYPLKHEVFQLLKRAYPRASNPARERLVAHAQGESVRTFGTAGSTDHEVGPYEVYNLAVWIQRAAPDCPIAAEFLRRLGEANPEFGPRDHPDLDHWSTGVHAVRPTSPIEVDELLASDPEARLDELQAYDPPARAEIGAPDRLGLLGTVQEACSRSPSWALGLIDGLIERRLWESDLWGSAIWGWREAQANENEWTRLLTRLEQNATWIPRWSLEVARLLERSLEDNRDDLTWENAESFVRLADILIAGPEEPSTLEVVGKVAWFDKAINHVGGSVAMIWMKALARSRGEDREATAALPEDYQRRFEAAISGRGPNALFARVVLASQLHFLFARDRSWVERSLMVLFDWSSDPLRAQQAWHGYLAVGRWHDALLSVLMPSLKQAFIRADGELREVQHELADRLAGVALYSSISPWPAGWLMDFVRDAGEHAREEWASLLAHHLEDLPPDAARRSWESWMRDYWEARTTGVPRKLSPGEATAMIEWLVRRPELMDEGVDLALRSPSPSKSDRLIYFQLKEKDLASKKPAAVSRLLLHLVANADALPYDCGYLDELVRRLIDAGADRAVLRGICEFMGRLGCVGASQLRALVDAAELH